MANANRGKKKHVCIQQGHVTKKLGVFDNVPLKGVQRVLQYLYLCMYHYELVYLLTRTTAKRDVTLRSYEFFSVLDMQ